MTDALSVARDLIRCPSVTPADAGALGVLEKALNAAGFTCHRVTFSEPGTADVDNLYARIGTAGQHFPPARGPVDRKPRLACSVAAVLEHLAANGGTPRADGEGSISFLITGDE